MKSARPFLRRTVRLKLVLALSAVLLGGCAKSPQERCREKGLSPGTIAFAECTQPDKREALESAQGAWGRLNRGGDR